MDEQQIRQVTGQYQQDPKTMKIERIACYIRVSTQEQKLHGISLDAQREKLTMYAKEHGLMIAGWYEDEGVSGRKMIKHRPALQRMLHDAQKGLFDRIIFIKIDRYFRSVAEYMECQKILEAHNVLWTATEEKFDLTSANGRYWVTQKLAMAEYEADQTGERIKLVNEYKVRTGQALIGAKSQGFGFTVKADAEGIKRVVKDEATQDILADYIDHFLTHHNKRQAFLYVRDKYNSNVSYNSLGRMLIDTKIYGFYRGNPDYCEGYVDEYTFNKIRLILKNNIKQGSSRRVYLFSGLIPCPICGRKMSANFNNVQSVTKNGKTYNYNRQYYSYRCMNHNVNTMDCKFNKRPNEDKIEAELLIKFESFIDAYITTSQTEEAEIQNSHAADLVKSLKTERDRLNRMYRKGGIDDDEYDKEIDMLNERIKGAESALAPPKERDLSRYEQLLKSDWKELYNTLTKENKRSFWHKYIKAIVLDANGKLSDIAFF